MWIRNKSQYPDAGVKTLIQFAAGSLIDTRKICINVRNYSSAFAGRAYSLIPPQSNAPPTAKYLVALRIGPPDKFPCDNQHATVQWVKLSPGEECRPSEIRQKSHWLERRVITYHPYGGNGSPLIQMLNWQEALVVLAAHELMHTHQFRNQLPTSEVQGRRFILLVEV